MAEGDAKAPVARQEQDGTPGSSGSSVCLMAPGGQRVQVGGSGGTVRDWRFRGDAIRHEHAELRKRLADVEALVAPLGVGLPDSGKVRKVLRFFKGELNPHMDDEERVLYPDVDCLVGGTERFTSTLRREHRIMLRWVVHLEAASERGDDPRLFARRAENLIGMLYAHMETEEAVLLPLVDYGHVGGGSKSAGCLACEDAGGKDAPGAERKAWWRRGRWARAH